jgi:hypothetical protein
MFMPDPDFNPSRIPDPTTATKEKGETNLFNLFYSQIFHKIENYFLFKQVQKK